MSSNFVGLANLVAGFGQGYFDEKDKLREIARQKQQDQQNRDDRQRYIDTQKQQADSQLDQQIAGYAQEYIDSGGTDANEANQYVISKGITPEQLTGHMQRLKSGAFKPTPPNPKLADWANNMRLGPVAGSNVAPGSYAPGQLPANSEPPPGPSDGGFSALLSAHQRMAASQAAANEKALTAQISDDLFKFKTMATQGRWTPDQVESGLGILRSKYGPKLDAVLASAQATQPAQAAPGASPAPTPQPAAATPPLTATTFHPPAPPQTDIMALANGTAPMLPTPAPSAPMAANLAAPGAAAPTPTPSTPNVPAFFSQSGPTDKDRTAARINWAGLVKEINTGLDHNAGEAGTKQLRLAAWEQEKVVDGLPADTPMPQHYLMRDPTTVQSDRTYGQTVTKNAAQEGHWQNVDSNASTRTGIAANKAAGGGGRGLPALPGLGAPSAMGGKPMSEGAVRSTLIRLQRENNGLMKQAGALRTRKIGSLAVPNNNMTPEQKNQLSVLQSQFSSNNEQIAALKAHLGTSSAGGGGGKKPKYSKAQLISEANRQGLSAQATSKLLRDQGY
jgi:hypothetical protein